MNSLLWKTCFVEKICSGIIKLYGTIFSSSFIVNWCWFSRGRACHRDGNLSARIAGGLCANAAGIFEIFTRSGRRGKQERRLATAVAALRHAGRAGRRRAVAIRFFTRTEPDARKRSANAGVWKTDAGRTDDAAARTGLFIRRKTAVNRIAGVFAAIFSAGRRRRIIWPAATTVRRRLIGTTFPVVRRRSAWAAPAAGFFAAARTINNN